MQTVKPFLNRGDQDDDRRKHDHGALESGRKERDPFVPVLELGIAGRVLSHKLKRANATAMTWTTDSAASEKMAEDPVIQ